MPGLAQAYPLPDHNLALTGLTETATASDRALMVSFTAGATRSILQISVYGRKVGNPLSPLRGSIRTGTSQPSCVASSAAEFQQSPSNIGSTDGWIVLSCVTNCNPTIIQGFNYWMLFWDIQEAATNYYVLGENDQPYASYASTTESICERGVILPGGLIFAPFTIYGTPTVTPPPSNTVSPTVTQTWTASPVLSHTDTPTITTTYTATPTYTPTITESFTVSPTVTWTPRNSFTSTFTLTPAICQSVTTEDWQSYSIGQTFATIPAWTVAFSAGGIPQVVASTLTGGRAGGQPGAGGSENVWTGETFTGDTTYDLEWQSASNTIELYFHMDAAKDNGYQLQSTLASGTWSLNREVSGILTQISSWAGVGPIPNNTPQTVQFRRVGNNINIDINGINQPSLSVTDATFNSGSFGFGGQSQMEIGIINVTNTMAGPCPTSTPFLSSTYTPRHSFTDTPTITLTGTPFTPTKTSTWTPRNTFTYSPTVTQSFTPGFDTATTTPTARNSSTYTPTITLTGTPFTPTKTITFTPQNSFTYTPTFTVTPTVTPTFTHTPSRTFSATYTATPTVTETFTYSPTFTHSPTATPTFTVTPTFTHSPTATPTVTLTSTWTPRNTFTYSPTITPTNTPFTPTKTVTYTPRDTFTDTPTSTATPTITQTFTHSPTRTFSFTYTQTKTLTFTLTHTPTPTITETFTITQTFTVTKTVTPTFTNSPTITPPKTKTPTPTASPTFTQTPVPGFVLTSYLDTDGDIYAMALDGTTLYFAGNFTLVGATARQNIAAINAQTGSLLSWDPGLSGGTTNVSKIIPYAGNVYVFGDFTTAGGSARNRAAAIDAVTGLADTWNPNLNGSVRGASIDTLTNTVYLGGSFTDINSGTTRNRIAAVDATTGIASGWDPNSNGTVEAVEFFNSTIYIGGSFTTVNGGTARNRIAALANTTGIATSWDPNADGTVYAIAPTTSAVWLGGGFNNMGGFPRQKLAGVNTSDAGVRNFDPTSAGTVINMEFVAPETLYVAGLFTSVGGQSRSKFASVDTEFSTANAWVADSAGGSTGRDILVTPWAIFVGGQFTSINAVARTGIAATVK